MHLKLFVWERQHESIVSLKAKREKPLKGKLCLFSLITSVSLFCHREAFFNTEIYQISLPWNYQSILSVSSYKFGRVKLIFFLNKICLLYILPFKNSAFNLEVIVDSHAAVRNSTERTQVAFTPAEKWKWKLLYSPWNSPSQNTGMGSHSLLQGIFPTQGSSPGLPYCRQILYQLSPRGSPRILEWLVCPFSSGFSQPRNWTGVSWIAGGFFTSWATGEAQEYWGA